MRFDQSILAAAGLGLAAALLPSAGARAGEPIPVSGQLTCKTLEQHAMPVDGEAGHVLVVQKVSCTGAASGESARFDGGRQTWTEADDLIDGSGQIHGYELAWYKDASTGFTSYAGTQTTIIVDGKPDWTAEGTFEQIRGTGSLAHAQLKGKWTARPNAPGASEFVMDWEGALTEGGK